MSQCKNNSWKLETRGEFGKITLGAASGLPGTRSRQGFSDRLRQTALATQEDSFGSFDSPDTGHLKNPFLVEKSFSIFWGFCILRASISLNFKDQSIMKNYPLSIPILCMIFLGMACPIVAHSQAFTGPRGSVYGGVINIPFQPASAATMPYSWQLEVVGINGFVSSQGFVFTHHDPQYPRDSSAYGFHALQGDLKRWIQMQSDVSLLNFQLALPHRYTLGLGIGAHSILSSSHPSIVYDNTMKQPSDFFVANSDNRSLSGTLGNAQWMDVYVNLAKVLKSNDDQSLSVGGTLQMNKGMSAEWVDIRNVMVQETNPGSATQAPQFTGSFDASYAYSSNLDQDPNAPNQSLWSHAMHGSSWAPSLSIGVQYVHRLGSTIAGKHDANPADYNWKLEAALTDFGALNFPASSNSLNVLGTMNNDALLRFMNLIDTVNNVTTLTDSLKQQVATTPFAGPLKMSLPAALRLNVDKKFSHGISVNLAAVLDASILVPGVTYRLHTLNYAVLTPRWEIKHVGFYLPLYINQYGKGLLGAAVRLGPLLLGLHSITFPFQHEFSQGGAYMSLIISHFKKKPSDCPKP